MSVSSILVNSNSEEQKAILEILEFYDYNKNTLNDDENKIKSVRHNELHKILAEKDILTPSRTKNNSTLATSKPTPTTPTKGLKRKLDTIFSSPQQVIRFFEEYKHSDPKKIKLYLKLCNFVVSKSLPISIVDAVEFREFLSLLDNRYKPPNSQTLKNTIIPRCREKIKFILIEKLNKVESINLITDIWSDTSMRSFIAFAVHGIDDEWGIFRALLCCKHLIGSHTNEAIFNTFMDIINEYNLGGKVFKIASDGASNMVKAFNTTHIDDYIDTFQQLCQSIDEKVDRDNELNTDEVESEDEDVGDGDNDGLEIDENIISTDTIAYDISLELYNVGRVGCAAHKLQLAIKDGSNLEVASDLIKK
ncbi:unnamed protein product [Brachionus calyciflorus]|uniref:Uncharacterized protein n=1 Tax=Brachionus calyciflorus TaxID=104777 RepID=A0A814G8C6_9BILA|nr:unnamed protein product [Brachionus calyciflorus]